mgnify:CR=1 FL=1
MNRLYTWLLVSCCCVSGPSALADEFACTPAELFTALSGPDREIENITHDSKRPSLWIDFSEDKKVWSDELMVSSYKDFGVFVQPLYFHTYSKDEVQLEELVALGLANDMNQHMRSGSVSFERTKKDKLPVFAQRQSFPFAEGVCELNTIRIHFKQFDKSTGYVIKGVREHVKAASTDPAN